MTERKTSSVFWCSETYQASKQNSAACSWDSATETTCRKSTNSKAKFLLPRLCQFHELFCKLFIHEKLEKTNPPKNCQEFLMQFVHACLTASIQTPQKTERTITQKWHSAGWCLFYELLSTWRARFAPHMLGEE